MKKKFIVFAVFVVYSVYGFGQTNIKHSSGGKISKSTIDIVYGHYIQNGNHSAVTGGKGTEKLQVFSPEIIFTRQVDSLNSYTINAGVDMVSSASTDNIDFAVSSASKIDGHGYLTIGYDRKFKKKENIVVGSSLSAAIESDYLSKGGSLSFTKTSRDKQKEFSVNVEAYFDDLRWGRLNGVKPLRLVYPVELRYANWLDEYRRYSYNLQLGYQNVINEKMIFGIFPGVQFQEGLLSTPFHRVYFKDGSLKVEKLPDQRFKFPLGLRLNAYLGNKMFLKNYYRFYYDNFGIIAHTFNAELAIKLNPEIVLTPHLRFYIQKGASFFKPYKEHDLNSEFYTSDYDLSAFQSYEAGIESRFSGTGKKDLNPFINNFTIRYSFYKRSDRLYAHIITLLLSLTEYKRKVSSLASDHNREGL